MESIMTEEAQDTNRKELWKFYEKAIEGRNSFYEHYVRYMNLYAIFTGAFFVALYNVFDGDNVLEKTFTIIISLLGFGSSILWLGSVKGYYAWIINWIKVVQHYEDLLNEGRPVKDSRFVYRLFFDIEKDPKARRCCLLRASRYSTQKLTMLFIEMIIAGWISVLSFVICNLLNVDDVVSILISIGCCIVFFLLLHFSDLCKESLKDNVDSHYKLVLVSKNDNEIVHSEFTIENKGGDE